MEPWLKEARRLLAVDGTFSLHVDFRGAHFFKVLLGRIFQRASFMNEIIWAYEYDARSKSRWSAKHDNIFWCAKDPKRCTYRFVDMDRIPYMAPALAGPMKAARGKTPTDVWWQTIVSPNGKEGTSYPTQKPVAILVRIVRVNPNPGDRVLDFIAGSGTTGAAARAGRNAVVADSHPDAARIMAGRLAFAGPRTYGIVDIKRTAG